MRSDQRQFHIFDAEIGARKDGATIPSMDTVVSVWKKMKDVGRLYKSDKGSRILVVGDVEVNSHDGYTVLLIRISDKKFPNSVYSDLTTGTFDEHIKGMNMGADFACHVIVSNVQEYGMPNIYTAAVEKVNGLPSALVKRLLSKMLNEEFTENPSSYKYPSPNGGLDKNGNPRMERCCPHIELRGRPSEKFVEEIEKGVLKGVTLIRSEPITPITGAGYLLKERTELTLGVAHQNLPAQLWNSLKKTLSDNSTTFSSAKVAYRLPNSTRVVTVEVDTASAAPLVDLYIQAFELVNIFPPLAQSAKKVVPHLRDAAVPEFLARRTV